MHVLAAGPTSCSIPSSPSTADSQYPALGLEKPDPQGALWSIQSCSQPAVGAVLEHSTSQRRAQLQRKEELEQVFNRTIFLTASKMLRLGVAVFEGRSPASASTARAVTNHQHHTSSLSSKPCTGKHWRSENSNQNPDHTLHTELPPLPLSPLSAGHLPSPWPVQTSLLASPQAPPQRACLASTWFKSCCRLYPITEMQESHQARGTAELQSQQCSSSPCSCTCHQ